MGKRKDIKIEDIAIQDTLSMTAEERIELLANLIVEHIIEDQQNNEPLFRKISGVLT